MKISTKGHYAVQALVDMAESHGEAPVSISVIAVRQELSQNYLEQLFVKLRKAGLVKSVRGPGGGYLMAKSPSTITIGDVFSAVDESLILTDCADENGSSVTSFCSMADCCKTQGLWAKLGNHFNELLYSITIADVLSGDLDLSRIGAGTVRSNL